MRVKCSFKSPLKDINNINTISENSENIKKNSLIKKGSSNIIEQNIDSKEKIPSSILSYNSFIQNSKIKQNVMSGRMGGNVSSYNINPNNTFSNNIMGSGNTKLNVSLNTSTSLVTGEETGNSNFNISNMIKKKLISSNMGLNSIHNSVSKEINASNKKLNNESFNYSSKLVEEKLKSHRIPSPKNLDKNCYSSIENNNNIEENKPIALTQRKSMLTKQFFNKENPSNNTLSVDIKQVINDNGSKERSSVNNTSNITLNKRKSIGKLNIPSNKPSKKNNSNTSFNIHSSRVNTTSNIIQEKIDKKKLLPPFPRQSSEQINQVSPSFRKPQSTITVSKEKSKNSPPNCIKNPLQTEDSKCYKRNKNNIEMEYSTDYLNTNNNSNTNPLSPLLLTNESLIDEHIVDKSFENNLKNDELIDSTTKRNISLLNNTYSKDINMMDFDSNNYNSELTTYTNYALYNNKENNLELFSNKYDEEELIDINEYQIIKEDLYTIYTKDYFTDKKNVNNENLSIERNYFIEKIIELHTKYYQIYLKMLNKKKEYKDFITLYKNKINKLSELEYKIRKKNFNNNYFANSKKINNDNKNFIILNDLKNNKMKSEIEIFKNIFNIYNETKENRLNQKKEKLNSRKILLINTLFFLFSNNKSLYDKIELSQKYFLKKIFGELKNESEEMNNEQLVTNVGNKNDLINLNNISTVKNSNELSHLNRDNYNQRSSDLLNIRNSLPIITENNREEEQFLDEEININYGKNKSISPKSKNSFKNKLCKRKTSERKKSTNTIGLDSGGGNNNNRTFYCNMYKGSGKDNSSNTTKKK